MLPRLRLRELGKALELAAAALGHERAQVLAEIGEEEEGLGRRPLLSHEEQGYGRGEEEYRGRRAHRFGRGEGGEALAEGAVADLIVILEKAHEARGGKPRARLAPRPAAIGRPLALIREALGEAAGEMGQWRAGSPRSSRPARP